MRKSMNLCSRFQLKKCSRGGSLPEDRISSLPDDILLLFLSFLTFKEVAMTSILSRRWLKLWVHNPVLHFHAPVSDALRVTKQERRNYVKWVNSVLRLHKGHYLKEFRIFCNLGKHNQKDIDSWLEYALARKVQNLELNFLISRCFPQNQDDNCVFPKRLLNLSHEKAIEGVNSNSGGSLFPKLNFNSLKSLSLKCVDVTGEAIHFFLLNCPYLERLEVAGTTKLVNLVISDPTLVLKYLQITNCYNLKVLSISNFNLVSLYISALRGGLTLTLTDLPMLVELSISGTMSNSLRHCFSQSSSCHSQLEALRLEASQLEDIIQLSNLSQMTKLKHLFINFGVWRDESLTKLFSFIHSCPHLVEFVLVLNWYGPTRTSRALCKGEKCSHKCLKVFEFIGYYGRVSDVELIMHVAENAVGLEKVIIDPRADLLCWPITSGSIQREHEARSVALLQFDSLRESIPSHVDLVIR